MKSSTVRNGTMWSIQILLAVVFISVGMAKLTGVDSMVQMFGKLGLGQWLRYVTGMIEFISGVLMFSSVYSVLGASLIVCTMVGAVLAHLFLIGGNAMPAFLLGSLSALLLLLKRSSNRSVSEVSPEIPIKKSA